MVDAEYAEHLAALQAEMRGEYEYRKGELERWRSKAIDQMCEGLDHDPVQRDRTGEPLPW
jgi:hypothetical protein